MKAAWRDGPDVLPARVVGGWVARKGWYVDRLVSIFATGMKNRWPQRGYLELFAGPGLSWDRDYREFVAGSAVQALRHDFTHYGFVDLDPAAVDALKKRIQAINVGDRRVRVLAPMDCNDAVKPLRSAIPASALTLAFVDPTNWQVRLETIAGLVDRRRTDLLVTFHGGSMRRQWRSQPQRLDAFFGTDAWRQIVRRPSGVMDGLLELYNRQLEPFGYQGGSHRYRIPVRNRRGVVMYHLVAFSKHPRGVDFWRKVISGTDESGQAAFWDWNETT